MSDAPVSVERIDLGIIDGFQTYEVRRTDTGEVIGYDQTAPTPDEPAADA